MQKTLQQQSITVGLSLELLPGMKMLIMEGAGAMKTSFGSPGHAGLLHLCQQEHGDGVGVSLLLPPICHPILKPQGFESVGSITQCIPACFGEKLSLFLPQRR